MMKMLQYAQRPQTPPFPMGNLPFIPYSQCHCEFYVFWPWAKSECGIHYDCQVMLIGSGAVILKKHTEYAVGGLLGVVVIQGFGYGLIFDLNFFLRNLSVIGGLFMVFSDSMVSRKALFAGLPSISETDRKK